jgi:hypothetical protein
MEKERSRMAIVQKEVVGKIEVRVALEQEHNWHAQGHRYVRRCLDQGKGAASDGAKHRYRDRGDNSSCNSRWLKGKHKTWVNMLLTVEAIAIFVTARRAVMVAWEGGSSGMDAHIADAIDVAGARTEAGGVKCVGIREIVGVEGGHNGVHRVSMACSACALMSKSVFKVASRAAPTAMAGSQKLYWDAVAVAFVVAAVMIIAGAGCRCC